MNICFIINDWYTMDPLIETSIRLLHECLIRGHNTGVLYPENLTIRNNVAYGFVKMLERTDKIPDNMVTFFKKTTFKESMLPLSGFDAIFVRKNPPIDSIMLNFLDSIKDDVFIINDVEGMRKANNKLYTVGFYAPDIDFLPETHVSKNKKYLKRIIDESVHDKMILKPLNGYGGSGVIVIEKSAKHNINSLLDFYIDGSGERNYVILQEYVEGAQEGDVRVLMLNGKAIGAYRRVPAEGDIRSNIHAGGSPAKHELTPKQKEICNKIGHKLVADRLYFVGVDIIQDKLIEVNVLSPGGITNINKLNKLKLQKDVIDFVESAVNVNNEQINKKDQAVKRKHTARQEIFNA